MILALRTPTTAIPAFSAAGTALEVIAWLAFVGFGIVLTITDVRYRRLPNVYVLALTFSGVLFLTAAAVVERRLDDLWRALAALGISFVLYLVLALLARGGLGAGDVKLAAPVGLYLGWLGWEALGFGLLAAFVIGGVVGLAQAIKARKIRGLSVPFGPFMLFGVTLTAVLVGLTGVS